MTNLDTIQYVLIFTGVGLMIYGAFWPGLLIAGIGALVTVARRMDRG